VSFLVEWFNGEVNQSTVYVFIDASNLWQAMKAKGRFLDFEKVGQFIQKNSKPEKSKLFITPLIPRKALATIV
jgi:hypothetical protein